jgi:hypothetical protein
VGIGLDRAEIVDGDDVDVLAARLVDGAGDVAADTAETVDGDLYRHSKNLLDGNGSLGSPPDDGCRYLAVPGTRIQRRGRQTRRKSILPGKFNR